jgi:hypothetical protein
MNIFSQKVLFLILLGQIALSVSALKKDTANLDLSSFYKRTYITSRTEIPPQIDGKLNDACWKEEGTWSDEFVQQNPKEGAKASQRTILKILYDNKFIFVAFICYDSVPQRIQHYIGNRDEQIGDMVGICFDSYFDHRTAYEFDITAGGSLIDLNLKNDGNADFNWNAVWDGKTAITDSGWTAEFKIPFSQLRYNNKDEQIWGMHAWRWIARNAEEDQWSLIPRNNAGPIFSFGELHGINNLPKSRRVEFMPYTLAKYSKLPVESNNPLSKANNYNITLGIDGKMGIGSDFTLDYTVIPDFGQVEADPSVMNLSAFETFYSEKRPFFLEGKSILDYNIDNDILFYSRRIGHFPLAVPEEDENNRVFVQTPSNTDILDAVKITGKTSDGLSIGVLQSLTNIEYATVDSAGKRYKVVDEPLTNYLLLRIQKDYNKGNSTIGGIFTSTNRDISDSSTIAIDKSAYTGGLDYTQYINDRNYYINFKSLFSSISGDKLAILELQKNSAHYYQRPDARYLNIDSSLTRLNGYGGKIELGRTSKNKLSFFEYVSFRSPGLDLNDIGYQQRADYINQHLGVSYHETKPRSIFREYSFSVGNEQTWNYGGQHESNSLNFSSYFNFINKWQFGFWMYHLVSGIDTRLLRGGSSVRSNPFLSFGGNFSTDWSKKVVFSVYANYGFDNISNSYDYEVGPQLYFTLSTRFRISSQFSVNENHYDIVYVNTIEDNSSIYHYITAKLSQTTYHFTLRANYNISPNISFQYYGSPFISFGNYFNFKEINNPMAKSYTDRYRVLDDKMLIFNPMSNSYSVVDNTNSYSFDNPDFQFRQFRSNFVFRWEFKPASCFYFVWSNQLTNSNPPYKSSLSTSLKDMFTIVGDNIFMIKLNYYFSI